MRWWYESLADVMVANPRWTQNELAAHFGKTAPTISTIVNTDAFKAYFRQRRDQHAETLDAGVRNKMFNVVDKSLELILESLEKKRDTIPLDMLQRTAESTLKSLGYGAEPRGPSVSVNVQQNDNRQVVVPVAVSIEDLEAARTALRANQMRGVSPPPLQIEHENTALGRGAPTVGYNAPNAALGPRRADGRGETPLRDPLEDIA